jgi:hypothetical protein
MEAPVMGNSEVLSVHIPLSDVAQTEGGLQIDLDKLIQEVDWALREPGMTVLIHGGPGLNQKQLIEQLTAPSARVRSFPVHSFDELNVEAQHAGFVAFIEQIADRRAPVHFALCGVSEALRVLVAMHESCYNFDAKQTTDSQRQDADQKNLYLISERLFWDMFNEPTFARSL